MDIPPHRMIDQANQEVVMKHHLESMNSTHLQIQQQIVHRPTNVFVLLLLQWPGTFRLRNMD